MAIKLQTSIEQRCYIVARQLAFYQIHGRLMTDKEYEADRDNMVEDLSKIFKRRQQLQLCTTPVMESNIVQSEPFYTQSKIERALSDYGGSELDSTEINNGQEVTSSLNPFLYKSQDQWTRPNWDTNNNNNDDNNINSFYDFSTTQVTSHGDDSGGHFTTYLDDTIDELADAFRPLVPRPGYICNICRIPGHYIQYCPQAPVVSATPYQGNKQCIGMFICHKCKRQWKSNKSFAGAGQECKKCHVIVHPKKQYPMYPFNLKNVQFSDHHFHESNRRQTVLPSWRSSASRDEMPTFDFNSENFRYYDSIDSSNIHPSVMLKNRPINVANDVDVESIDTSKHATPFLTSTPRKATVPSVTSDFFESIASAWPTPSPSPFSLRHFVYE